MISPVAYELRRQVRKMSDFEVLMVVLTVIGLLLSVYKLGKK